eukprot:1145039-Pelagomonas_calceolata.AAC.6
MERLLRAASGCSSQGCCSGAGGSSMQRKRICIWIKTLAYTSIEWDPSCLIPHSCRGQEPVTTVLKRMAVSPIGLLDYWVVQLPCILPLRD